MNILYIWDADYPWDVRVEKICKTLAKNGNEVHIAARNLKKLDEYEVIGELKIHRLKSWKNDNVNYLWSFPIFFSFVWKRFLDRIIIKHHIDLIIVRDLPMAIAGIWAGRRHKLPVIFDMAENYIAMLKDIWKYKKFEGINLVARNPYLGKIVERYVFKRVDHILVVVNESMDIVVKSGVASNKVTVVGNTPLLSVLNNQSSIVSEDLELIETRFSAIYVGGIQLGRGLHTVIEAIPEIVKKIPSFLFVVLGDGYAVERLKGMIREKRLENHILWVGWVYHESVYDYIRKCKIGLIPHLSTEHTNTTVPNKLFDYMGIGLPVVTTNAASLERILSEENCGLVFESSDAHGLAKAVIEIYQSENKFGENGNKAVRTKYNWERDEKKLLETINKVVTRKGIKGIPDRHS